KIARRLSLPFPRAARSPTMTRASASLSAASASRARSASPAPLIVPAATSRRRCRWPVIGASPTSNLCIAGSCGRARQTAISLADRAIGGGDGPPVVLRAQRRESSSRQPWSNPPTWRYQGSSCTGASPDRISAQLHEQLDELVDSWHEIAVAPPFAHAAFLLTGC